MRVPTLLVALVLAAGCLLYGGTVLLDSERGAPWSGWGESSTLRLDRSTVEFGSATVGEELTAKLVATNGGEEPVRLASAGGASPFALEERDVPLAPGSARTLTLRFRPETAGEFRRELTLRSEGFAGGEATIALRGTGGAPPELALAPEGVRFGRVSVDGRARAVLNLENRGGGELRVDVAIGPPFRPDRSNLRLAAGASEAVELTFEPEELGAVSRTLVLRANDPKRRRISIPLEGEGVQESPRPEIAVRGSSVDFGKVRPGDSRRRLVTIENRGDDPLMLTSLMALPPFRGVPRSRTVPPRSTYTIPVVYAPKEEGKSFSPLVVYSNDPDSGPITLSLFGEASADASPAASRQVASAGSESAAGTTGSGGGSGLRAGIAPLRDGEAGGESPAASTSLVEPEAVTRSGGPRIQEGSEIYFASYTERLSDPHVQSMVFEPGTRSLRVEGLRLPTVDAAFGERFRFGEVNVQGSVSELGEIDTYVPVQVTDKHGNEAPMFMRLTTGTARAKVGDGREIAMNGRPLGSDGSVTLVGIGEIPSGTMKGHVWRVKLNARVEVDDASGG